MTSGRLDADIQMTVQRQTFTGYFLPVLHFEFHPSVAVFLSTSTFPIVKKYLYFSFINSFLY
jgi:hypothetical protein